MCYIQYVHFNYHHIFQDIKQMIILRKLGFFFFLCKTVNQYILYFSTLLLFFVNKQFNDCTHTILAISIQINVKKNTVHRASSAHSASSHEHCLLVILGTWKTHVENGDSS